MSAAWHRVAVPAPDHQHLEAQPCPRRRLSVGVVAIATPITLALNYTDRQSLRELESQAAILAAQALPRNQQITDQVYQAVRDMEAAELKDPCSPQAMERMIRASMRASRLQTVGYVENMAALLLAGLSWCGPGRGCCRYVSPGGLAVRDRRLPYDDRASSASAHCRSSHRHRAPTTRSTSSATMPRSASVWSVWAVCSQSRRSASGNPMGAAPGPGPAPELLRW